MQPLQRVIGVGGLTFSAVNIIVGSGIFGLPSVAAAGLGAAAPLSYAVCAVLVCLVGLCLAEAGSRVAGAGGLYVWISVPFGPIVGGIAGTMLWFSNGAAASAAVADLLADTLATLSPALKSGFPRAIIISSLYGLLAAVNIRGARYGVRLSVILAIVKIAPLLVLIVTSVSAIHGNNLTWSRTPSVVAIGQTAVVVFFAFTGIETALCASGEVKDPTRSVPWAIVAALTVVTILYLGLQLAAQGVLGTDLAQTQAPLVTMATHLWGPWGARILISATLVSVSGFLAADVLCSPRVLHALAAAGQLPRRLGDVHKDYGTPSMAIAGYSALCAVLAISGSFRQLLIVASSGTLVLYLICVLGLLRMRQLKISNGGTVFQAPGGAILPVCAAIVILWLLSTLEWKELLATFGLLVVAGSGYALHAFLANRGITPI